MITGGVTLLRLYSEVNFNIVARNFPRLKWNIQICNTCFEVSPSMKIKQHVCINVQMPRILHFAANIMSKVVNLHRNEFLVFTFTLICNKQ